MTANGDFWGLMGTKNHGDWRSNRWRNSPKVPISPQDLIVVLMLVRQRYD